MYYVGFNEEKYCYCFYEYQTWYSIQALWEPNLQKMRNLGE